MSSIILKLVLTFTLLASALETKQNCKCIPSDPCWPSSSIWSALNDTVSGRLIQTIPPAKVCYLGPQQDAQACQNLATELTNSTFIGLDPVALDYPITDSCPAIFMDGIGNVTCALGTSPVYAINATRVSDVIAGVNFARQKNIRLVIRNTGHDLLGRSTGAGSLEVWIRHLREGLEWIEEFVSADGCEGSRRKGGALKIKGGYVWGDVHSQAEERGRIVVGGGDPTVGCLGGWAQAGGHSPASRDYGLGADQIIEAEVVLADGSLITANACQNSDVFFAIRGGGGGTYGIVVSTTVRTYPTVPITAQIFSFAPISDSNIPQFMDALSELYTSYPALNDAGFSGYGSWAVQSFAPPTNISNSTTGYTHTLAIFNSSTSQVRSKFASTLNKFQNHNNTLLISVSYIDFPTYAEYYKTLSGVQQPVGSNAALGSRLLDRPALTSNRFSLAKMLNATAGSSGQFTSNNICLVSGGANFLPDETSGLLSAWRRSYLHNIVARGWAPGTTQMEIESIHKDISEIKVGAMRTIAPRTGSYINEGDRFDEEWKVDFYGGHLGRFEGVKRKRDPEGVFWCPVCVGSDWWTEDGEGRLCRV